MSDELHNAVRRHRDELGLSQQALAQRVGVSRQAISAIEAGRQVPSTSLALGLAHALGCSVESLFQLAPASGFRARLAPPRLDSASPDTARVSVGAVGGRWVAHRVPPKATVSADGIIGSVDTRSDALVEPLTPMETLARNILVAGCAPLLGALAHRVANRFHDARVVWIPASSKRALELLDAGFVHAAGIHLADEESARDNVVAVRDMFGDEKMVIANLTRWRQGFVVGRGNPHAVRDASDLLAHDVRFVQREEGAGARKLVASALKKAGAPESELTGPIAWGHEDVARYVACGAADVGVAIESVALASGLDFVPLADERFDLVLRHSVAGQLPVRRLIESIDDVSFRTEAAHLPGYDTTISGHVTTLEPE